MNSCCTPYCTNKKKPKSRFCFKCLSRKYRKKNPIRSAFYNLKSNAKRRGKVFTITFEEFEKFATETNYIFGKGRSKNSFHIDRIDESKGYSIENIQVLTNTENVKKYLKYHKDQNGVPFGYNFKKPPVADQNDCPF